MLDLSFCNELLADEGLSLDRQCEIVAELGYMGLELSLGSLTPQPHLMSDAEAARLRQVIEGHGLGVTGIHWLLAPYPDLSITDAERQPETARVLIRLVQLCAVLGGRVLVHGSPAQRQPPRGADAAQTEAALAAFFAPVAAEAERQGVTYCIEPLSPVETPVITTVAAGARLVDAVDSVAFRTMIDISAAGQAERAPVADLLRTWLPTDKLAHVQANDSNRGAPGMGDDPFPEIVRALRELDWPHPVALEPFRTCIDATTTAAIGAATMKACWAAARDVPPAGEI